MAFHWNRFSDTWWRAWYTILNQPIGRITWLCDAYGKQICHMYPQCSNQTGQYLIKCFRLMTMLMIFDLLTPPQGHQLDLKVKFLLVSSALLIILFNLICYMTMFRKSNFWPPQHPQVPPPPEAWPRRLGKKKALLHTPFMGVTHTTNLVGFRPMV